MRINLQLLYISWQCLSHPEVLPHVHRQTVVQRESSHPKSDKYKISNQAIVSDYIALNGCTDISLSPGRDMVTGESLE